MFLSPLSHPETLDRLDASVDALSWEQRPRIAVWGSLVQPGVAMGVAVQQVDNGIRRFFLSPNLFLERFARVTELAFGEAVELNADHTAIP